MFPFAANWPGWVRSAVTDAVEGAVTALFLVNLVIPGDLDQAKAEALMLGAALVGSIVAAARRAIPSFVDWFKTGMGVGSTL